METPKVIYVDGEPKEWLTYSDVRNRYGISTATLHRMMASGELPYPKKFTSQIRRFPAADLLAKEQELESVHESRNQFTEAVA